MICVLYLYVNFSYLSCLNLKIKKKELFISKSKLTHNYLSLNCFFKKVKNATMNFWFLKVNFF